MVSEIVNKFNSYASEYCSSRLFLDIRGLIRKEQELTLHWNQNFGKDVSELILRADNVYVRFCKSFENLLEAYILRIKQKQQDEKMYCVRQPLNYHWNNRYYTHINIKDKFNRLMMDVSVDNVILTYESMKYDLENDDLSMILFYLETMWGIKLEITPNIIWVGDE